MKVYSIFAILTFNILAAFAVAYPPIDSGLTGKINLNTSKIKCENPIDFIKKETAQQCQSEFSKSHSLTEINEIFSKSYIDGQRKLKKMMVGFNQDGISVVDQFPQLNSAAQYYHRDNIYWGYIINTLIAHILDLKSVGSKERFCKSLPLATEQFALQYGFTKTSIAKINHQKCFAKNPNAPISWFGNQLSMKDYLVIAVEERFPYSGWTDSSNTTYLFIKPSTTWGDLVTAIIHEIAVGMDGKMFRGPMDDMLYYQMSGDFDEESFVELRGLVERSFVPTLSYTFSAMRANRIMLEAIKEVSGNDDIIETESPDIEFRRIFNIMKSNIKTFESPEQTHSLAQIQAAKYIDIDTAADFILKSKTQYPFGQNQEPIDFLTYMATPRIGKRTGNTTGSNGPGCGYCGGSFKPTIEETWNTKWKQITATPNSGGHYESP